MLHNAKHPTPDEPGKLQRHLTARGIRLTRQRRVILGVIESAKKHLDAAQILRRAAQIDARINRVTVYRTLGLLKREGLVDELDLLHVLGEGHYYEARPPRDHLHITCLRCGNVIEFESSLFERLKGQIQRECEFEISVTRMEVGGHCAKCRS